MALWAVRISGITVRKDRIVACVDISDERFATTSPQLFTSIAAAYPHLAQHACVNDRGTTFGAVAACTSVPHLLEHMVIERQACHEADAMGASGAAKATTFVGKTSWIDRAALRARVEVNYADDLVALGALRAATEDLNRALLQHFA